jgi:hypothetical protein
LPEESERGAGPASLFGPQSALCGAPVLSRVQSGVLLVVPPLVLGFGVELGGVVVELLEVEPESARRIVPVEELL